MLYTSATYSYGILRTQTAATAPSHRIWWGGGREKPDWCTQVFLQCLPTPEFPSQVKHVARPCWRQRKSHPALKQLRVWLADLSALVSCLHYFSSS